MKRLLFGVIFCFITQSNANNFYIPINQIDFNNFSDSKVYKLSVDKFEWYSKCSHIEKRLICNSTLQGSIIPNYEMLDDKSLYNITISFDSAEVNVQRFQNSQIIKYRCINVKDKLVCQF